MAFVLNLPSIDARMVLGQLQMRQERPVLADDMPTTPAANFFALRVWKVGIDLSSKQGLWYKVLK